MQKLLNEVCAVNQSKEDMQANENNEEESAINVDFDFNRVCSDSGFKLSCSDKGSNSASKKRWIDLHTFLHGTMGIIVQAMLCLKFGRVSFIDGRHFAMFSASRKFVYCREFLDL